MRHFFHIIVLLLVLAGSFSCGNKGKTPEGAAEKYYSYLVKEKYDRFVEGIAYSDSMPQDYKEQMQDVAAQYIDREKKTHGGIRSVRALDSQTDGNVANAYLELIFEDSLTEEIAVPMVKCGEVWKMQ